jgi:cell wall-associated NlpC family hydrolase
MPAKTVSGGAVALMAVGGVAIWSGLNNVPFLDAVRALAKGQAPTPNRKPPFQPLTAGSPTDASGGAGGGSGGDIVTEAEKWIGVSKYVYGGCHGCTPCAPGQGVDCSSFVTWVMQRTGHYKGKCSMVAGSSMLAWGRRIPWESRQPGDVALWPGKHCAIITGPSGTIEASCTACGPVRRSSYGKSHAGIGTVILRAPDLAVKPINNSNSIVRSN